MTETTVLKKGCTGNNVGCVPCGGVSFAQRARLFSDEDGLPAV